MIKRDIIILGGGAGGLNVASACSQLGLKVTLIEKAETLGGDCLHYGCVPSKSFIHTAKLAHHAKLASQFYKSNLINTPEIDIYKVNQYVKNVIDKIQVHDSAERFESFGCEVIFGHAEFINKKSIKINDKVYSAKFFVLATGSSPAVPPIPGLKESGYETNETIFNLDKLPKKLCVMGAGPIGLELAQSFARLGSEVTVIEMLPQVLAVLSPDEAATIQAVLENEGIKFLLDTKVVEVAQNTDTKIISCEINANTGEKINIDADCLLVATGRRPNIYNLNLEAAGVKYSSRGIAVDNRLRSSNKKIFAIGDVVAQVYQLTHMAEYHAGIIVANTAFRVPQKISHRNIPAVIYTEPEVAVIGVINNKADKDIQVLKFSFKDVDRALTESSQPTGFIRLFVKKQKILGAVIIGPSAGELLSEVGLAIQAKLSIKYISATVHAYPTLSQIIRRAVNTYYGEKLFNSKTKVLVKWINRLIP